MPNWGAVSSWAKGLWAGKGAMASAAWGNSYGKSAMIGAGVGAAYGGLSDRGSMLGGAMKGAALGAAGMYGYRNAMPRAVAGFGLGGGGWKGFALGAKAVGRGMYREGLASGRMIGNTARRAYNGFRGIPR
jgi:hypothetical protein